jgi:hypothetical protein
MLNGPKIHRLVAGFETIGACAYTWKQLRMAKESNRCLMEFKNHGIVALGERIVGTTRSTIQKIVDSIAGPLLNNPDFFKKICEGSNNEHQC